MAKRRTKKEKMNARVSYSLPDMANEPGLPKSKSLKSKRGGGQVSVVGIDTKLLQKDLTKTVILSVIILVLELLLYYYWR